MVACIPQKKILYFQQKDTQVLSILNQEPIVKAGDLLSISVASISPEASAFFAYNDKKTNDVANPVNAYLVDNNGNIDIPLVGELLVKGKTTSEIKNVLKQKLEKYLNNPSVAVRIANFKITLLGDFNKPGVYSVDNNSISILEAIGLGNDLTIYANRTISLIREKDGKREFYSIDLTNRKQFETPILLQPNDVIYAEPSKSRTATAENFYKIAPIAISSLTFIGLLILNLSK